MKRILHYGFAIALMIAINCSNSWAQITTFEYTGAVQTYVVPPGVTSIQIDLSGAEGFGNIGEGGSVIGNFTVTPGETLEIYVGGQGGGTTGGYNGGGIPGSNADYGGGGGASDVRQGGSDLTDRIVVAGGGGGSGSNCGLWSAEGGNGGGLTGESGCVYSCSDCQYTGAGGTAAAGGIAGPTAHASCPGNTNGSLGQGGTNNVGVYGTGGGGGYYGGGSGCFEGAGGGSSYADPSATDVIHTQGGRTGNGVVTIELLCSPLTVTLTDAIICLGDSFVLEGTGSGTISWDGDVVNGESFTPAAAGDYIFTSSSDDASDCPYTTETITVNPLPEVSATATSEELCEGDFLTLSGAGAEDYEWFPADGLDGEPFLPEVGTTTYTVIGTDINNCENEATIDIIVHALPVILASASDLEICLGESITLEGSGGVSYTWDPADITDGATYTPATTGTFIYTVEGLDVNGCVADDNLEITVYDALNISSTTIMESAGDDGEIDITVTGGSMPYSFDWDNDGTGDFDDTEDLTGLAGGTYNVVVMCAAGCEITETATVDSELNIDGANINYLVYPNPTTGEFVIQFEGTFNYEISTIDGATLFAGTANNQTEVNLENMADGVYFVTVSSGNTFQTIKIIKK